MTQDNDSPIERFAQMMGARAFQRELSDSYKLGASHIEAYRSAFAALDETYLACFAPHRAFVHRVCRNGGWW